ncbi:MAG TPA: 4Fe-4S dicluster domain-containing protein [Gammaproteobacteria bacterium]|nr:4Fe-4S dicluster domain-containing protein [Gammaproteobacteria bacterium]
MLTEDVITWLFYLLPVVFILIYYSFSKKEHKSSRQTLTEMTEAGLTEPASLHPVIDPAKCLGCGACATACPEGKVIGLIHGKAQLIHPTKCIGHGACKRACPFDAITLVFGTEKRGIDIPNVAENFETNIPGIFIAGELGGMGLIRNAIEQGRQAMESIRKLSGIGKGKDLDVIIVGAGPAGFSASLSAKHHGLKAVTLEQDSLGGTVYNFPRGKIVMTAPVNLPIIGKVKIRETTKEALLKMWLAIEKKTQLKINYKEKMDNIIKTDGGFEVVTNKNTYKTRSVLLTIGRRGTPRKLGVPGEEQAKVVYRLIDPAQYQNQHVLVVGGGDSALEAALSIAEEKGTQVTISYRSESFSRAKQKNQDKIKKAVEDGNLKLVLPSTVKSIDKNDVILNVGDNEEKIKNDGVIVCAGGILPTPFLKEIGIEVETKHGQA